MISVCIFIGKEQQSRQSTSSCVIYHSTHATKNVIYLLNNGPVLQTEGGNIFVIIVQDLVRMSCSKGLMLLDKALPGETTAR